MKNYTVASKIALVICFCFIMLAVVNGFTGFINDVKVKSLSIVP